MKIREASPNLAGLAFVKHYLFFSIKSKTAFAGFSHSGSNIISWHKSGRIVSWFLSLNVRSIREAERLFLYSLQP